MPTESIHKPVLASEVVLNLVGSHRNSAKNLNAETIYLDCTLGGAGHALAIANALNGKLKIIGLDQDQQALDRAKEILKDKAQTVVLLNKNFRELDQALGESGTASASGAAGKADIILFDLGISSDELENSGKGFSFQKDEPLLMTMGDPAKYAFTAKDIVNNWEEETLADIIFGYGEEKYARRIAKAIVIYRQKARIETSSELAEIVKSAMPGGGKFRGGRWSKIHPATKTFQALRIAVNDELGALKEGLEKGWAHLNKKGRMGVVSFHSLEDKIVKDFYKQVAKESTDAKVQVAKIITKKPIRATAEEIAENPRSRSAKFRVIEKI